MRSRNAQASPVEGIDAIVCLALNTFEDALYGSNSILAVLQSGICGRMKLVTVDVLANMGGFIEQEHCLLGRRDIDVETASASSGSAFAGGAVSITGCCGS